MAAKSLQLTEISVAYFLLMCQCRKILLMDSDFFAFLLNDSVQSFSSKRLLLMRE